MNPRDEEIDSLVAMIRAEHHEPMRPITKIRLAMEAADMLLALKARAEAAEKRVTELAAKLGLLTGENMRLRALLQRREYDKP